MDDDVQAHAATDEADTAPAESRDKVELLDRAARAAGSYVAAERTGPVTPSAAAIERLDDFASVSLDRPIGPSAALDLLDAAGSPAAMRSTGGRYFGFVNGGVTPVALAASVLAGAWDQNTALPVMSPVGAAVDRAAADLLVDVLALPRQAVASFCAGATIANLTGIVTARDHLLSIAGWDVLEDGLMGAPPLQVIASAEVHVSALKALRLAGLGTGAVTLIDTDDRGRLRPDAMPAIDGPALVLLQAGNVNTGHSDPFRAIIEELPREHTWVHVDGAFGLWANAVPHRRELVDGVELADSWATDAHKWLNAPYDCGVAICAHPERLRRSMAMDAAYVATSSTEGRPLMNLGVQMSQGARAVPVWAILASEGRAGVADMVERCCANAQRFADRLAAAGAEVLAPVALNQVLVSFGDDAVTDRVVDAVQREGTCWMGATTWHDRRAMRISVSDTSTTAADVDLSVDAIISCWHQAPPQ